MFLKLQWKKQENNQSSRKHVHTKIHKKMHTMQSAAVLIFAEYSYCYIIWAFINNIFTIIFQFKYFIWIPTQDIL